MPDTDIRLDLQTIRMEGDEIKDVYREEIDTKGLEATIVDFAKKYNVKTLRALSRELSEKFGQQPRDVASNIAAMEKQLEDLSRLGEAAWQAGALEKLQVAVKMGVYVARVRALQQLV